MCKILILKGFVPDSERGFFVRLGGEILATADSLPTPASKLAGDRGCGNDRQEKQQQKLKQIPCGNDSKKSNGEGKSRFPSHPSQQAGRGPRLRE